MNLTRDDEGGRAGRKPLLLAIAGLVAIVAAIALTLLPQDDEAGAPASAVATPLAPAPPAAAPGPVAPSFDVVRINRDGEAVMAGRAAPDSEVVILDGGKEIGRVTADARGDWVFVPEAPLAPGSRELGLRAVGPDGRAIETESSVVLVVPERGEGEALVVKVDKAGRARVLAAPGEAADFAIVAVTQDDGGRLTMSGAGAPEATVRAYIDNRAAGEAKGGGDGQWTVATGTAPGPGLHTLRVDRLGPDGKVTARVETPYMSAEGQPQRAGETVVVQPGNSLWRLARRHYGQGTDYLVIFQANQDLIRDPDLIYPGQQFSLPTR